MTMVESLLNKFKCITVNDGGSNLPYELHDQVKITWVKKNHYFKI